jgi:hypothetical protein
MIALYADRFTKNPILPAACQRPRQHVFSREWPTEITIYAIHNFEVGLPLRLARGLHEAALRLAFLVVEQGPVMAERLMRQAALL